MRHVRFAKDYFGVVHGIRFAVDAFAEIDVADADAVGIELDQPGTIVYLDTDKNGNPPSPAEAAHTDAPNEPHADVTPADQALSSERWNPETRSLDAPPKDRMVKKASKRAVKDSDSQPHPSDPGEMSSSAGTGAPGPEPDIAADPPADRPNVATAQGAGDGKSVDGDATKTDKKG